MEIFTPSEEQIENLLKSEGLFKQVLIGEDKCWELFEINEGEFSHMIHEVNKNKPFFNSTNFYVNERTCLKRSLNPFTNECEFDDISTQWKEILSQ